MAWTMTATMYLEDAELTVVDARSTVVHFGPFDAAPDVHAVVAQWLADGLPLAVGI